jgi:hypothetical protein
MKFSYSAIYQPILMKFGTQTKENMLNPKILKPEVPPFSKMTAAAVLKTIETVQFSHLATVFDESWYTG